MSEKCVSCGSLMTHPKVYNYKCPNKECGYEYNFYPESRLKNIVIVKESDLKKTLYRTWSRNHISTK